MFMPEFGPSAIDDMLAFMSNRVSPNFDKHWVVTLVSVTLLENALRKKLVDLGFSPEQVRDMSYKHIAKELGSKFPEIDLPRLIGLIEQRNLAVHEVYRSRISFETVTEAWNFMHSFVDRLFLPEHVLPRIAIMPRLGVPGELIGLEGSGLDRSRDLRLYFDGMELSSKFHFSSDGEFMTSFRVPDVPGGVHTVTLVDVLGRAATRAFTVLPPPKQH